MNIKLLFAAGLLAFASVSAQYYEESEGYEGEPAETEEESSVSESSFEPAPAPVPAPVFAEPVSSSSVSSSSGEAVANMNRLRGRAYNVTGNEAAPLTVGDYLANPHHFHSNEFVYLEPTNANGILSWGKETTFFIGLDNSLNLGLLNAGIATSSFGIGINLALGQLGDNWGAIFSMPLAGGALAIGFDWLTLDDQVSVSDVRTDNNWLLDIDANYSYQASNLRELSFRGGLNIARFVNSTEPDGGEVAVTADTRTEFVPYFNVATMILAHERARVFIGSNNALVFQLYDGFDNNAQSESHFEMGLSLSPNFLAELSVTEDFILFGEAVYNFRLFGLGSRTTENKMANTEASRFAMQSRSYETEVSVGARYQKERFAVEAILSNRTFADTRQLFNGTNTFVSLGGFIYF